MTVTVCAVRAVVRSRAADVFMCVATDITPDADVTSLLPRADLRPEQDVGFFVADVYVRDRR